MDKNLSSFRTKGKTCIRKFGNRSIFDKDGYSCESSSRVFDGKQHIIGLTFSRGGQHEQGFQKRHGCNLRHH